MALQFGAGTTNRKPRLCDRVLVKARSVGIAGDVESLQMALAATIGVYDQILATAPAQFKPLVTGAGEKVMATAREILEAV